MLNFSATGGNMSGPVNPITGDLNLKSNQVIHPFKTMSGTWLLRPLFVETNEPRHQTDPKYSLSDDRVFEGYPSLKHLYLGMEDITEYLFSKKYLGGWEHWKLLCSQNFFDPHIRMWREELELQIRAKALAKLHQEAKDGKLSFQATRFILEGNWKVDKESVGRPSKEKIKREAEKIFEQHTLRDYEKEILAGTEQEPKYPNPQLTLKMN